MVVERAAILDSRGRSLGSEVDLTDVYDPWARHSSRCTVPGFTPSCSMRLAIRRRCRQAAGRLVRAGQGPSTWRSWTATHRRRACSSAPMAFTPASARNSMGNDEPVYSGYTSWRGVTPGNAVTLPDRTSESWGRGERFGIVPIGFGEIYWFAVANTPPDGSDADVRRELMTRFGSWHEPDRGDHRSDAAGSHPANRHLRPRPDRALACRTRGAAGRCRAPDDAQPRTGCRRRPSKTPSCSTSASRPASTLEDALTRYEQRRVARANAIAAPRDGSARWRSGAIPWQHGFATGQ